MKITKEVIDWELIQEIVQEKTGKIYGRNYLRSVATRNHSNKIVENILIELGIMKVSEG